MLRSLQGPSTYHRSPLFVLNKVVIPSSVPTMQFFLTNHIPPSPSVCDSSSRPLAPFLGPSTPVTLLSYRKGSLPAPLSSSLSLPPWNPALLFLSKSPSLAVSVSLSGSLSHVLSLSGLLSLTFSHHTFCMLSLFLGLGLNKFSSYKLK
ncbi:hypothetical protein AAZX31_13G000600 [Glycine max]